MKNILRLLGAGLILCGFTCMPFPVTNPEATTSVFPWLAMNGDLAKVGAWAIAVGVLLFATSFVVRGAD
jgi:hypothetical protein